MICFILATMLILSFITDMKEKIVIIFGIDIVYIWAEKWARQLRAHTSLKRAKL